ncbi:unnamed protein product [Moneuplotes crassus]|uniref:Uncharacterized protein n=1 Tax=Euplotes crassus TaxID=5936 RepID=A0AAD1XG14_EUPCR|nr:unnamed protein product [Moneuplotes crassus]
MGCSGSAQNSKDKTIKKPNVNSKKGSNLENATPSRRANLNRGISERPNRQALDKKNTIELTTASTKLVKANTGGNPGSNKIKLQRDSDSNDASVHSSEDHKDSQNSQNSDSSSSDSDEEIGCFSPVKKKGTEQHRRSSVNLTFVETGAEYKGEMHDQTNKMDGIGEISYPDGTFYKGQLKQGEYHGKGSLYLSNGAKYEGGFEEGKYHGKGTLTSKEGTVYEGKWVRGKKHGYGTQTVPEKEVYEGDFKHDLYDGNGRINFSNGLIYTGKFSKGKFHGEGIFEKPDGSKSAAICNNGEIVEELEDGEID